MRVGMDENVGGRVGIHQAPLAVDENAMRLAEREIGVQRQVKLDMDERAGRARAQRAAARCASESPRATESKVCSVSCQGKPRTTCGKRKFILECMYQYNFKDVLCD